MSKELVVSSTGHETRVAILDDDKLVEVYIERATEHALVGSVYKGRVSRVLPGMQSAFVKVGLERDAFLYVSDIIDQTEEIESGTMDDDDDLAVASAPSPASAPAAEPKPARREKSEEDDEQESDSAGGRRRRGRRSRRGRGGRANASGSSRFPESKFADVDERDRAKSEDAREDADQAPARKSRREEDDEDFAVLPGESLAKYRGGESRSDEDDRDQQRDGRASESSDDDEDVSAEPHAASSDSAAESSDSSESGESEQGDSRRGGRRRRRRRGRRGGRGRGDSQEAAEKTEVKPDADGENDLDAREAAVLAAETRADKAADEFPPENHVEAEEETDSAADASDEPEDPRASDPDDADDDPDDEEVFRARFPEDDSDDDESEDLDSEQEDSDDEDSDDEDSDDETPTTRTPTTKTPTTTSRTMRTPTTMTPTRTSLTMRIRMKMNSDEEDRLGSDEQEDSEDSDDEEEAQSDDSDERGKQDKDDDSEKSRAEATARESRYSKRGRRGRRRRGRGGDDGDERSRNRELGSDRERSSDRERGPDRERSSDRERGPDRERRRDAGPKPDTSAGPLISDLLKPGQEIIVQIAKEPLGKKGARITSHIALPGRYLVYMPTVAHVGVSRKISSDAERTRLRRVIRDNSVGSPGGFIVRTAGQGKSDEELINDIQFLTDLWKGVQEKAEKRPAPALLHTDLDVVERILRDQLGQSYKTIWVDAEEEYERIVRFVERFQPDLLDRVKLYTRSTPIFDEFNITQEIEKALRPKVWLKSGGYIVINQTEALVAIDVNTGKYVGKSDRLEDTIVKTNLEAVQEIVRQMRLRDLGGIIVVDFIDMDDRSNRKKVTAALEKELRLDRSPSKALAFNDFGLVAITRKRVKQSLERALCAPCTNCQGSGYVKSPESVIYEILNDARRLAPKRKTKNDVTIRVHPEVARVLKSRENAYLQELEDVLGSNVVVRGDHSLFADNFDIN